MTRNVTRAFRISSLAATALFVAAFAVTARADWANFRGPNYDGISLTTGFETTWTKPIPLKWDREIGSAFSSFAVVGDHVYTCGTADKEQVLYCLNASTGAIVWKTAIEKAYRDNFGDGTRATPTVDDGRVYILGGHGRLLCADAKTGDKIWDAQFNNVPQWGYAGSVLIDGDLAITTPGNDQGTLVAFDKVTGEKRWSCGDDPAGYATPYPFTFEGTRYVVGFSGKSVIIAEAKTGKLAWREDWVTDWKVNASSPIYHDGHLFLSSGYSTGCALFRLERNAGKLSGTQVWKSNVLMNKFQSCILYEGALYASDQNGLSCVDFKTGKEHWKVRRLDGGSAKHGTLVLADGNLLLLTEDGRLKIAPANTDGFKPVTDAEVLSGKCWTVSVLDGSRLFARNLERVVCLDLSK
ncbi:MAG: PQQ-binding-like beta-propeller repeat protein [Phycisphaerales bacterium]|nr:PQQ-binding-like beta-propeller repeat protein [Phycisphaerales bacterium]